LHLVTVASIQECCERPKFHLQSQWNPETHLLPLHSTWETSAQNPFVLCCNRPLTFWAPSLRTIFCTLNFVSRLHKLYVDLETSRMMRCNSLVIQHWFVLISPSIFWRSSSDIKDSLTFLCSSWTSVHPSENPGHHLITFCRFIT
jgi:hypothetical protein